MSTLADFKPEQLAVWRDNPITQAMIRAMRDESMRAQVAAVQSLATETTDVHARIHAGVCRGWGLALHIMEHG